MRLLRLYFDYVRALGRRLFTPFESVGNMLTFLAAAGFIVSVLLDWAGVGEETEIAQSIYDAVPRASAILLLFLLLFHIPATIWRDAQPPEFKLAFPRVWVDAESGHRWVIRLLVLNEGPTGTFEAEMPALSLSGGEPVPTTHVPLGWAPRSDALQILDREGEPRSLIVGFAHTLAGTKVTPPGKKVGVRPDHKFDFTPFPGSPEMRSIKVTEDVLTMTVVVRDRKIPGTGTRQTATVDLEVWVTDDDRIKARKVNEA